MQSEFEPTAGQIAASIVGVTPNGSVAPLTMCVLLVVQAAGTEVETVEDPPLLTPVLPSVELVLLTVLVLLAEFAPFELLCASPPVLNETG